MGRDSQGNHLKKKKKKELVLSVLEASFLISVLQWGNNQTTQGNRESISKNTG